MGDLYSDDLLRLAEGDKHPDFDDTAFFDAAGMVYNAGQFNASMLTTPEARKMIGETLRTLKTGIDAGLPVDVPETVRYALENNAFIFSGFKAFHTLREVGLSLLTEKGEIKPFDTFRKDVEGINRRYNHNYLYAEYNHAVGASLIAARWQQLEQDGDKYDLQYRTAQDDRVREDHAVLHGITLPPSDPFWGKYMPPNGWNCRCTAVQVRKGKYPLSDPQKAMESGDECTEAAKQQIFRFNPGKELQLFPPKHPYYKAPEKAKKVVEQLSDEQKQEQRIAEIIAELPENLTDEQKKAIAQNCVDIEQGFGITKGKVMTYDQANKGKENPEYSKGGGYRVNCQTCTVTHWLRRLGFDVQAKPNIKDSAFNEMKSQGINWKQRFVNVDGSDVDYDFTYKWQQRKGYKAMTAKRLQEYFTEKFNADGVYEIYCGWKGGSAHVFMAEVSGGKVRYFDPQSGKDNVNSYIASMRPGMVGTIRIDDKMINPKLKNLFLKSK